MSLEVYAAGAAAAFTIDVLVYPLDTIKTRWQSQDYVKTYAPSSKQATQNAALAVRGLYQGIGAVVLATLPAAGIFFSTYESSKAVFGRTLPLPEPMVHATASGLAEMASCLVLAPAEVIKQNAQMLQSARGNGKTSTSSSVQAFRHLTGHGTGRRLFTGYTALVARNLPFTTLQFPAFEYLRSTLWKRRERLHGKSERGLLETGAISATSAATAGSFAAFITTPSDVVKTRMMIMAGNEEAAGTAANAGKRGPGQTSQSGRLGAWAVTQRVYQDRGVRGFFRGGFFRSAWTALGSGLYLGTYDLVKLWLERGKSEGGSLDRL